MKDFEKFFHKKKLTLDTIEMKIYNNLFFKENILRLFQIEKLKKLEYWLRKKLIKPILPKCLNKENYFYSKLT
jgi:hypothetical protein